MRRNKKNVIGLMFNLTRISLQPNENKMSDGLRERASNAVKGFSYEKCEHRRVAVSSIARLGPP